MNHNEQLFRIQQYIDGSLNPEQMYELERDALDDPFLQDALDGYLLEQQVNHRKLSLLQERLEERLTEQREDRGRLLFSWQRLGIAGVAGLLFILSCVLFWMTKHLREINNKPAVQKEVLVEMRSDGELEQLMTPFELSPMPDNKLKPEGGWQAFKLSFNQHLTASPEIIRSIQKPLVVSFEADAQGKAVLTRLNMENTALRELIEELLKQGPKWQGAGLGHFQISIKDAP